MRRHDKLGVRRALLHDTLALYIPQGVKHLFERTFQVAEDASTGYAAVLELYVREKDQVSSLSKQLAGFNSIGDVHVSPQDMTG